MSAWPYPKRSGSQFSFSGNHSPNRKPSILVRPSTVKFKTWGKKILPNQKKSCQVPQVVVRKMASCYLLNLPCVCQWVKRPIVLPQASLSLQPTTNDFFDVPGQSYTVSASTIVDYHTFIGMYNYVRLVHTPDASNAGTLDKVIYRS